MDEKNSDCALFTVAVNIYIVSMMNIARSAGSGQTLFRTNDQNNRDKNLLVNPKLMIAHTSVVIDAIESTTKICTSASAHLSFTIWSTLGSLLIPGL